MELKIIHPSTIDDRQTTDSDEEGIIDENAPETPYDGENMNASSDNEGNKDEDAPETPHDDKV